MLVPVKSSPHRRAVIGIAAIVAASLAAGVAVADDLRPVIVAAPRVAASSTGDGASADNRPNETDAARRRIQELIRQLGNPRYAARRAAASELRQIGAEAFDLLHAATNDADLEVAASSRYLLRQIAIRWVHNDDSPAVRALLRDYDGRSDESRLERVAELAKLREGEGLAALCRIARFDRSPLVSRMAALAVIRPAEPVASATQLDTEIVERELGGSTRESATWLRHYLEQLRDPASSAAYWKPLVDKEAHRLEQNADDTSPEIVLGLLWNLVDLNRQLGDSQAALAAIDRMIELDVEQSQPVAVELIEWLREHRAWGMLDEFLAKHQPDFAQNRRVLYYAALARAGQGKSELAEELAAKAAQLEPLASLESFVTAKDLEEHGRFEWAVREYRRAIEGQQDQQLIGHEAILARIYLATLLHDYEHHGEAADTLEPLAKAVQNEGRTGQLYAELLRYYRGRLALPEADAVAARYHYYRACQNRGDQELSRVKEELQLAIKFDPTDADVLIAMYHHPETDPQWREAVLQRVRDLTLQFQHEIDENPTDPTAYNQWAWLVSNTEGDYPKAIRYSHRSLELIPPGAGDSAGASFLDTLGRCYFAAGDYENAVKYQRQAIEKVDYMRVMHRQLAIFERALAADVQGAKSSEQEAEVEKSQ